MPEVRVKADSCFEAKPAECTRYSKKEDKEKAAYKGRAGRIPDHSQVCRPCNSIWPSCSRSPCRPRRRAPDSSKDPGDAAHKQGAVLQGHPSGRKKFRQDEDILEISIMRLLIRLEVQLHIFYNILLWSPLIVEKG